MQWQRKPLLSYSSASGASCLLRCRERLQTTKRHLMRMAMRNMETISRMLSRLRTHSLRLKIRAANRMTSRKNSKSFPGSCRSSMPSSGMATASISAPASSAAFATGGPCAVSRAWAATVATVGTKSSVSAAGTALVAVRLLAQCHRTHLGQKKPHSAHRTSAVSYQFKSISAPVPRTRPRALPRRGAGCRIHQQTGGLRASGPACGAAACAAG